MKKLILFSFFILLGVALVFAQDEEIKVESKQYYSGDGGVIIVQPDPSGVSLNIELVYKQPENAPAKIKERIEKNQGPFKGAMDKIRVRVFDLNGREMCKQFIYYNDFVLVQTQEGPVIVLRFNTQGCGKQAYTNVGNVVLEY